MDASACRVAATLLRNLAVAVKHFPDIEETIWILDRATLEVLPRDVLFESAVGLERILVSGAGDNSRRFRMYGTALLAEEDWNATFRSLKEIYNLRSSAAHGVGTSGGKFEAFSVRARTYLSEAIERVVKLVVAAKVSPKGGRCVSVALEEYLQSLLYAAARDDMSRTMK
jgi:hypothetical protein